MVDVNLNAMLTIKNAFKVSVGYSDHTLGIEVPIAAVALGATVGFHQVRAVHEACARGALPCIMTAGPLGVAESAD